MSDTTGERADQLSPLPGEIEEAKKMPNGNVYRIAGDFGPNDAIPGAAIVGAWAIDGSGNIVGSFIQNPNYDPTRWPLPK